MHIPWDYRSYFDEIDVTILDAIMQSRGISEQAAGLLVEIHTYGATLSAVTPLGYTAPVTRCRDVHQGGCSAPIREASVPVPGILLLETDGERKTPVRSVRREIQFEY